MKTIESRIAPNPKEAQIWVDLSADAHGNVRKTWNGKKWVADKDNKSITESEIIDAVKPQLNEIKDTLEDIKANVDFLNTYHDAYILQLIKELAARIEKLEQFIVTE